MRTRIEMGPPAWTAGRRSRFCVCLLAAALLIATLLSVLRLPAPSPPAASTDIVVDIVELKDAQRAAAAPEPRAETLPDSMPEVPTEAPPSDGVAATDEADAAAEEPESPDWQDIARQQIAAYADELDRAREEGAGFSPAIAAHRRRSARQYRPRTVPLPRPIWENVETDQLGRTLLWSGDCYRVLDEPNVTRKVQFEVFGQYLVTCLNYKHVARELPWVDDVRERNSVLRDPDGYVAGIDGA